MRTLTTEQWIERIERIRAEDDDSRAHDRVQWALAHRRAAEPFGAMLRRLRVRQPGRANGNRFVKLRASRSMNEVARTAGINMAYLSRLERGIGYLPRREVALALAEALGASDAERDRLLFSAGLAPVLDYQSILDDVLAAMARKAAS